MKDEKKTKARLIEELKELRKSQPVKKSGIDSDCSDNKDQILRMITDNVSDLSAILDLNGKRLFNSSSYKNLFGDPAKLKGTDSFREIHPDDREKIKNVFEETVKTGIGQISEYRFVLEDGSVRHIESQGDVIRDADGEIENVIVISRDITEREQIEQALHDSEERLKAILSQSPT